MTEPVVARTQGRTILEAALGAETEAYELDRLVRARIRSLLADRRWYRANRWAEWTDLRREGEVELRALLRLHRTARRTAAAKPGLDPDGIHETHSQDPSEGPSISECPVCRSAFVDHSPDATYLTEGRG